MKMLTIVQTLIESVITIPKSPQEMPLYVIRKERESFDTEVIDYICGKCGVKNNFKETNKEVGLYLCLNCGSENYLDD